MVVKIRTTNPGLSDLQKTTLTASVSSGTSISIGSNEGLSANDYLVIGNLTKDNAELKNISTISGLTVTVDSAIENSHTSGESISKTNYNQIQIYRASSSTGAYSLLTTVDVDFSNQNGETIYTDIVGTSAYYYKTKYYNETTTVASSFSDAAKGTGLGAYVTIEKFRVLTGVIGADMDQGRPLADVVRDLKLRQNGPGSSYEEKYMAPFKPSEIK